MDNQHRNTGTEQVRTQEVRRETRTARPLRASGGRKAVAVLLSMLLFFTIMAALMVGGIRWLTRQSTVENIITEQNVTQRQLAGSMGSDDTISAMLYRSVPEEIWLGLGLDRGSFDAYIEQSTWIDYIARQTGGIVQDVADGTNTTQIRSADFARLFEENDAVLENITGTSMSPEIRTALADSFTNTELGSLSAATFTRGEVGDALELVRPFISQTLLITLIVVSVVLAAIIILIMRGRYRWFSPNLAVPLILAGLVLIAFRILTSIFNEMFLPPGAGSDLMIPFTDALGRRFLIFGLAALGLGILMLIIRAFLPKPKGSDPYETATQRSNPYMN